MKLPIILVNFKCYVEATGKNALKLAKICEDVSKKFKVNIAVASQYTDIQSIASKIKVNVFAQSIDPIDTGAFTGHITALAIKEAGAIGTLINHSEKRLALKEIRKCIEITKKYGLISIVCSDSLMKSREIASFGPDFIAYEDSSLIGTGRAISRVKPDTVKEFVKMLSKINPNVIPLCGAGISTGEDVKVALELGTNGVIIASAVVKSNNPKSLLRDIAKSVKL